MYTKHMVNKEIGAKLLAMMKDDQQMRLRAIDNPDAWNDKLDRQHTATLKQIIKEYGWPTNSLVGEKAANAAWLLVQHADHDTDFQERCLELMKSLSPGEVSQSNIAYLVDRLLTRKGKPQLYGTQFKGLGKNLTPYDIEDRQHLDRRRKKMGLCSFEEYTRLVVDTYGEEAK